MELWDLYTKDREKTGQTMIRGQRQPEGLYRLVVHVCIFNRAGEMLIQRRQPFKRGWSDLWDITVGGSAVSGDTSKVAVERELLEELGLSHSFADSRPTLTLTVDGAFDDIYLLDWDGPLSELRLQYEEVQAVRWASLEEILRLMDEGRFIFYHRSLIALLFALHSRGSEFTQADPTTPAANERRNR